MVRDYFGFLCLAVCALIVCICLRTKNQDGHRVYCRCRWVERTVYCGEGNNCETGFRQNLIVSQTACATSIDTNGVCVCSALYDTFAEAVFVRGSFFGRPVALR